MVVAVPVLDSIEVMAIKIAAVAAVDIAAVTVAVATAAIAVVQVATVAIAVDLAMAMAMAVVDSKAVLTAVDLATAKTVVDLIPVTTSPLHQETVGPTDPLADTKVPMPVDQVEMATATIPAGVVQVAVPRKPINTKTGKIKKAVSRRYNLLSLLPSGPGEVNRELAVPPVQR